jgi:hypothetical protein
MEKECRRCFKSKPLSDYYQHKQMFDGYLNVCKECTKSRVKKYRVNNIDRIKEYERNRLNKKQRSIKNSERVKRIKKEDPVKYHKQVIVPKKKWIKENPEKRRAQIILGNAVRDKRIDKPKKCSMCSKKDNSLHGHHDDYSKPLDVTWLCAACHRQLHRDLKGE